MPDLGARVLLWDDVEPGAPPSAYADAQFLVDLWLGRIKAEPWPRWLAAEALRERMITGQSEIWTSALAIQETWWRVMKRVFAELRVAAETNPTLCARTCGS